MANFVLTRTNHFRCHCVLLALACVALSCFCCLCVCVRARACMLMRATWHNTRPVLCLLVVMMLQAYCHKVVQMQFLLNFRLSVNELLLHFGFNKRIKLLNLSDAYLFRS